MTRFILAFFSIYALVHAFFYSRARVLLPDRWSAHVAFILCMAALMAAPIGARLLERSGHGLAATVCAAAGYSWMGFLFISFWCFLLTGIASVAVRVLNGLGGWALPELTGRAATLALLGIVVLINGYGFFEARSIGVERVVLKTAKLPPGVVRVRIAQITDVHLGLLVGEDRVVKIMEKVRAEKPDILVSTGDLVDGDMEFVPGVPNLFKDFNPPLGKFAVTGNHEAYAGIKESIAATKAFGFRLLEGESVQAGAISICGVDDPAMGVAQDERKVLLDAGRERFNVLLKHRPEVSSSSTGLFDLQLSGHTHRGQVFPFRYISERVYPMQDGLYRLGNGSLLYTSRGSGTWGPPIRVLSPPEVTIIDIVRE
jgi:uncharacterized protein